MMTRDELAAKLHGRQYCEEITVAEAKSAKESGLLVLFGASDDLVELRGAIDDEVDAYEGTTVLVSRKGNILREIDRDDQELLERYGVLEAAKQERRDAIKIKAKWCDGEGYSWKLSTDTPHAEFEIFEGDEKYCLGLVIDLSV